MSLDFMFFFIINMGIIIYYSMIRGRIDERLLIKVFIANFVINAVLSILIGIIFNIVEINPNGKFADTFVSVSFIVVAIFIGQRLSGEREKIILLEELKEEKIRQEKQLHENLLKEEKRIFEENKVKEEAMYRDAEVIRKMIDDISL